MHDTKNHTRIGNLDVLRALAALAVCFFHFRRDSVTSLGTVYSISSFGHLGVDVFFVISGFVIPLMMNKMQFKITDSCSFLLSRFIRLYPAYIAAMVLASTLWFLCSMVPGFRGESATITLYGVLSNCLLICEFTGEDWVIPVSWTLAIEAQYYFLIAISYPLFSHRNIYLCYGTIVAWIAFPHIGHFE